MKVSVKRKFDEEKDFKLWDSIAHSYLQASHPPFFFILTLQFHNFITLSKFF